MAARAAVREEGRGLADGRRAPTRWDVWGLSAVGMTLLTVATRHGPGLSIDSVNYLSAGVNLADDGLAAMLADQPLTIFPPGLPTLAALGELIGIQGQDLLRVLSILAFGAVVVLGNRLICRVTEARIVAVLGTATIALAPALFEVTTTIRSEPFFILATLAFLSVLADVASARRLDRRAIVKLVALCWAAFALRYAGVALNVSAVVVLCWALPRSRRALTRIGVFAALSFALPVGLMLRNHAADGTYMGPRLSSHDTPREIGSRTAATFGSWLSPVDELSHSALATIGLLGVAVAIAAVAFALRTTTSRTRLTAIATVATFAVVYVAYLSVASYTTLVLPTDTRYLSPAYVPAVVLLAGGLGRLLERGGERPATRPLPVIVIGLTTLLVVGQVAMFLDDVRAAATDGIEYNTDVWLESELAQLTLRAVEDDRRALVYSNEPFGLWSATRLQPLLWAPRDVQFRGGRLEGELEEFEQMVACSEHHVYVSFYLLGSRRVVSLEEMRQVVDLEPIATADDGVLLRATSPQVRTCPVADVRDTAPR